MWFDLSLLLTCFTSIFEDKILVSFQIGKNKIIRQFISDYDTKGIPLDIYSKINFEYDLNLSCLLHGIFSLHAATHQFYFVLRTVVMRTRSSKLYSAVENVKTVIN